MTPWSRPPYLSNEKLLLQGRIETFCMCNSQTECNMEMKFISIDFSCRVAEVSRSSWLQTLGNQLINRSSYIRYTTRTERDMEIKLTSIDFSCRVGERFRSSQLQTLGNQRINCSSYIRYTNRKCYCIIILDYVNKSQVNAHVV